MKIETRITITINKDKEITLNEDEATEVYLSLKKLFEKEISFIPYAPTTPPLKTPFSPNPNPNEPPYGVPWSKPDTTGDPPPYTTYPVVTYSVKTKG